MWKCGNCDAEVEDKFVDIRVCWKCGYNKEGKPPPDDEPDGEPLDESQPISSTKVGQRPASDEQYPEVKYPALVFIAGLPKVWAWISAIVNIILASALLLDKEPRADPLLAVGVLVAGFIWVTFLFALSEIIRVFLDIELNTRTGGQQAYRNQQR